MLKATQTLLLTAIAALAPGMAAAQNVAVQWNANLLKIVRIKGAQPATIHPTRSFAMMHIAIYDAVNSIDQAHRSYVFKGKGLPGDSQDAAAAQAAHDVLLALYPSFQRTLDQELQASLKGISAGSTAMQGGIRLGQWAAAAVLAARVTDGSSDTPPPFVFGSGPGVFQEAPPNFAKPQFTNWSKVKPFTLRTASQFRPGPPPELSSDAYSAAFTEIKSIGMQGSTTATTEQRIVGRFWNGAVQNYWNEIAQTAATRFRLSTPQAARLFALMNIAVADTVIAFYDAKYTYQFWRPVTAVRAANVDTNPGTTPDPTWLPQSITTAADPSYPGAHAAISSAAATVLASVLGTDESNFTVTSEVLAGFGRVFGSFSAASKEAFESRIDAGQHFRTDEDAGAVLGTNVAEFALANTLTPAL